MLVLTHWLLKSENILFSFISSIFLHLFYLVISLLLPIHNSSHISFFSLFFFSLLSISLPCMLIVEVKKWVLGMVDLRSPSLMTRVQCCPYLLLNVNYCFIRSWESLNSTTRKNWSWVWREWVLRPVMWTKKNQDLIQEKKN